MLLACDSRSCEVESPSLAFALRLQVVEPPIVELFLLAFLDNASGCSSGRGAIGRGKMFPVKSLFLEDALEMTKYQLETWLFFLEMIYVS